MSDEAPNSTDASKTLKDLQAELSTLGRVSHRLAMTDAGPALEKVLTLLLPRLLSRIGKNDDAKKESRRGVNKRKLASTAVGDSVEIDSIQDQIDEMYDTIHKELIEMLGHIMKRVRHDGQCKLPCISILDLLVPRDGNLLDAETANAFTVNLSLAFLTLGVNRCTPVECCALLPGLLKFLEALLLENNDVPQENKSTFESNFAVGVGYLLDPSRKIRHNQTRHLILRCLERVAQNPAESAATARRAVKSESSVSSQSADRSTVLKPLASTKELMLSSPIISAAMFDLFLDIFLYAPIPATSTLIPNGMSTAGYQCLVEGAASEESGCKSWREEFASKTKLKELKVKLLDLIAPCRRFAIFLPDKFVSGEAIVVDDSSLKMTSTRHSLEWLGMSRTVALMVMLLGDSDLDVKSKAESYLRAHMDSYRGKETPANSVGSIQNNFNDNNDPLLGNQVALVNSILANGIGDVSSNAIVREVLSTFESQVASDVAKRRLGLVYLTTDNSNACQKAVLACCRMKISDSTLAPALRFIAKVVEDNPKFFHVGLDMVNKEADIAAVSIGSLVLTLVEDLWKPGSSGSPAVEAAATLLNALCLRLTHFYDSREQFDSDQSGSSDRLQSMLARSLSLACSVVMSTSSGQSTSLSSNGTRTATIQLEIRDKMYGVISTLARSKRFCLDEGYSLFDCGKRGSNSGSFVSTATASLLFGCAKNEVELLRTRATSALDALLAAYVRVVKFGMETREPFESEVHTAPLTNPWASAPTNTPQLGAIQQGHTKQRFNTDGLSRTICDLLWHAARRGTKSSRLAAARWSHELLLLMNPKDAYHLLCFFSGDDDVTVSMIAKKALGIENTIGEDVANSLGSISIEHFNGVVFSELMVAIIGKASVCSRLHYDKFHIRAQAATLRFLLQLLLCEGSFYGDDKMNEYVLTILNTLSVYKSRSLTRDETDLLDECAICLSGCTSSSQEARLVVKDNSTGYRFEDICEQCLASTSSKARRHFAEVIRSLYEDLSLWNNSLDPSSNIFSVASWIVASGLFRNAELCRDKLETMLRGNCMLGEVHGAAFLGSSCVRAFRLSLIDKPVEADSHVHQCWEVCGDIVSLLGKGLSHIELAVGNSCSQGLMIAFGYSCQDAPILDSHLYQAMAIALDGMNNSLKKYSSIDHADPTRVSSLIRASGVLLAASTSGAGHFEKACPNHIDLGPARLQCVESLFAVLGSAVHRKDEEISLTVGEALVKYADSIGFGEWSSASDLLWEDGPYNEAFSSSLPPHQHVLYRIFKREIVSTNPTKKTACSALLLAIVGHASRLTIIDHSFALRDAIREVLKHLEKFQYWFIQLLADPKSKQLARECACKGLAACRGLCLASGDGLSHPLAATLNERLLKAFGQTSNHGRSAMIESEAQARERREGEEGSEIDSRDTEVGGTAGLGEAALGAYREMANAAMTLDRPDILYTLMILATNHPIWLDSDLRDRYSAKSLLGRIEGLNGREIRGALEPHLGKLIPSLLRACNDPNKQTREQMNSLWVGLTGGGSEARDIITRHFIPTLDSLMKDAVSKLWRARTGACGALSDIIVGRSWDDLGGGGVEEDEVESVSSEHGGAAIRLLRLWKLTVRALDDVRAPVRERGESLGRALRALTIRLCDPMASNITADEESYMSNVQRELYKKRKESNAEVAATVSLSWLIRHGLNQPCAEATGICISSTLGIVDVAKPSTLQPVLDSLVGSLLMAMSALEPAALNYLQVRAAGSDAIQGSGSDSYDRLESMRVRLAMSGPIYEALNKCLDMIQYIDLDAQKKIVPELDGALRRGAGFATRAAAADAVTSLCSSCPNAFKFPGVSTSNPSVRLLRALYFASERERGASSKDKMTHALGSLAELAPGKAVRTLATRACERYSESSGSNNDPSVRRAAASTLRAIVVRASGQLQDGGPRDIWMKVILPTAFLGRHDKDSKVASLWNDVWEEGGTAVGNREDTFGTLLQERLLPFLNNIIIDHLRSNSWANRTAACAVLTELADANILAPIPSSVNDINVGIGSQERFRVRAAASCSTLSECVKMIARSRIWAGKADVVKAATLIAGKWTGIAPMNELPTYRLSTEVVPLVIRSGSRDDLFEGDLWFKSSYNNEEELDELEANYDDEKYVDDTKDSNDDTNARALDLTDERNFDEDDAPSEENVIAMQDFRSLTFCGFCRLLCDQGLRIGTNEFTEGVLPYKSAVLGGLSNFLRTLVATRGSSNYIDVIRHQRLVYGMLAPGLYSFASNSQGKEGNGLPPLLVAKSLECLASAFFDEVGDAPHSDYSNPLTMLKFFADCSGVKQPAWSVRQSAVLAASSLVSKMSSNCLGKNDAITTVIDCSSHALKDRKFWKVR
eukprot:CCRYP_011471-RA/>CCRYP_011471-RA protein AED:0.17 eAED:0.17 QI:1356/1/1/1/1/1/5/334/2365